MLTMDWDLLFVGITSVCNLVFVLILLWGYFKGRKAAMYYNYVNQHLASSEIARVIHALDNKRTGHGNVITYTPSNVPLSRKHYFGLMKSWSDGERLDGSKDK